MIGRNANPTTWETCAKHVSFFVAGLHLAAAPAAFGRQAPGIEFAPGAPVELAAEPGSLTTFAASFSPVPASLGIRYQVDVTWLTTEAPSPGGAHDSFFFSLLSADGSRVAPLFGVDVFGLHPESAPGFSLHIDPLTSSASSSEQLLSYRVLISAPDDFLIDGSWAVIDLADTGDLGGSRALVAVAMVPEPGSMMLAVAGSGLLWWALRRGRLGGIS